MTRAPLLLLAFLALPCAAQTRPAEDPFAAFERHTLSNGMRLWLRVLPGAPDVSVGVVVPFGWDRDPVGKEETAHYLEHVLFSDHRGVSEEEIKDQVESRGGSRNGFTTADRTLYYVTTPAEYGLFGVDWLGRVVEPHDMEPAIVERNRQPVALEIGARPRQLLDRLRFSIDAAWLHRPDFWRREFGLTTRSARRYDPWSSLQAVGPDDLKAFYERYYVPEAMTLVLVGDVDPVDALARAETAFGSLPRRPVPEGYERPSDPGRPDRTVSWTVRPDIRYQRLFKVYDMDADRHVRLLFLARLLDRRLTARLRFGETKAVYGIGVEVVQRGPAAYLSLNAGVDPHRFAYATGVIDEELAALVGASDPPGRFEADRSAIVEQVIAENRRPQDLVFQAYRAFYRPEVHASMPDLPARFASLTPGELAEEARALTDPGREFRVVVRPHPLPQLLLGLAAAFLALVALRLARRVWVTPLDRTSLRYVTRVRASPGLLPVLAGLWVGAGVAMGMVGAAAGIRLAYRLVVPRDVYVLHLGMWGVAIVATVLLLVLWATLPPRKLLVLEDHLRVKYLSYRSRRIPFDEIDRIEVVRLADLWRRPPRWSTLPMALGLTAPALLLQPRHGAGLLARVRRPDELIEVVRRVRREAEERVSR